jgi:hypothetical protein
MAIEPLVAPHPREGAATGRAIGGDSAYVFGIVPNACNDYMPKASICQQVINFNKSLNDFTHLNLSLVSGPAGRSDKTERRSMVH